MVLGRTIDRVCVDERAVWAAFLCEACEELMYHWQSDIFLILLVPLNPSLTVVGSQVLR